MRETANGYICIFHPLLSHCPTRALARVCGLRVWKQGWNPSSGPLSIRKSLWRRSSLVCRLKKSTHWVILFSALEDLLQWIEYPKYYISLYLSLSASQFIHLTPHFCSEHMTWWTCQRGVHLSSYSSENQEWRPAGNELFIHVL